MSNRRVLVKRRKSVRNICKITRTMQLIATARYQQALNRPSPRGRTPRSWPSWRRTSRAAHPVYGTTKVGSLAGIVGRNNDKTWWAISVSPSLSSDGIAWVYSAYVTTKNAADVKAVPDPPLPANVTPSAPGSSAPAAIALEPINVRSGPGNAYTSYGTVPIGTIMAIIGVSPDKANWVIKLPTTIAKAGKGWVAARYTSATNTGSVPVVQPPPAPK